MTCGEACGGDSGDDRGDTISTRDKGAGAVGETAVSAPPTTTII